MNAIADLSDDDSEQLMNKLAAILNLAGKMARDGNPLAHEIYVSARDARDLLTFDAVSRETLRRITGRESFQGYDVSDVVKGYIKNGQKINAIKEFRTETGLGLKEAKDWVEAYVDQREGPRF